MPKCDPSDRFVYLFHKLVIDSNLFDSLLLVLQMSICIAAQFATWDKFKKGFLEIF